MRKLYVTFGGVSYDRTTAMQLRAAQERGDVDRHIVYDDRWLLESGFIHEHSWLWNTTYQPHGISVAGHGFGHCSWKPYVILDAMCKAADGDLILYTDADTYPVADMTPLFDICDREGMVLFEEQGCLNRNWIKRDCYIAMGCDEPKYWDAKHGCGRFQLFKNGLASRAFVKLWADYSVMRECQLHDTGTAPNLPEFKRHSTEQAILTLLGLKHGIPFHRTPDQNGWPHSPNCGVAGDEYAQIFKQEWCDGDKTNMSGSQFRNV